MNDTIRSILGMLEAHHPPELKIAAAQVLGELAPKDASVVKSLAERLEHGEDFLARHVLTTLACINSDAARRVLVAELGGRNADLVAHLLAELGNDATAALSDAFDGAHLEVRLRMLGILGRMSGAQVAQVAERAIVVAELSRRAGEVLAHAADGLDGRQLKPLKARLAKALGGEDLPPQCAASILAVLAKVDGAGSRPTLIKYCGADQPAMVRQAALQALRGIKLTPTQAGALLEFLDEDDDVHVVEPVLALLQDVEKWPDAAVPVLRQMLTGRKRRQRLFAARALRHAPDPEIVKPLCNMLHGDDAELAAAASAALAANEHACEPLLRSFLQEKDIARARRTMEPLVRLGRGFGEREVRSLLERGSRLLLAHDPMGEVVLALLVRAQPEKAREATVDKAVRLRRQRKFADAVALLAFLAAADQLDTEGRYQLALSRLLFDAAERRENGATGDATMGYFARLVRDGFPVLDRLKKESMVTPEDLLRVGQHFTEAVGEERRFGAQLLHHLADKHARRRAGEEARSVLRAEGL